MSDQPAAGAGSVQGLKGYQVNRPRARDVNQETLHNPALPPGHLLADRAKKARAESACCLCGRLIRIGERIGRLTDGTGWAHVAPCITVFALTTVHLSCKTSASGRQGQQFLPGRLRTVSVSEQHLSPEDLAEREGVPLQTVYGWNKDGTAPPRMRLGRHVRYRLADVIAWEKSRLVDRQAG